MDTKVIPAGGRADRETPRRTCDACPTTPWSPFLSDTHVDGDPGDDVLESPGELTAHRAPCRVGQVVLIRPPSIT